MSALLDVIIPVFLIIGFGYCAVWVRLFSIDTIDSLMKFSQNFAIPVLLFSAIAKVDLGNIFDLNLFFSFYVGATAGFLIGFFGSHYLFSRPLEDSVAIGFCCLFSNTVMLGLPHNRESLWRRCSTKQFRHCIDPCAVLLLSGHHCDGTC